MNFEQQKAGGKKITELDDSLKPEEDDHNDARSSVNVAKKYQKKGFFLTKEDDNLEDLARNAPLIFQYVPTRRIMQKLIKKSTEINQISDLDICDDLKKA